MRLMTLGARSPKPRPSSTIVQPFSHVRFLEMQHMPSVVGWILLSKSMSTVYASYLLMFIPWNRLDLSTEKVNSLGMHDDSISSMTFVRSTSITFSITSFLALVILKSFFRSRQSCHWFMGSYTPFLGPEVTKRTTKHVWDTRKDICSRLRQQQPRRRYG